LDFTIPSAYDIRQAIDLKGVGIDAVLYPKGNANPTDKELKAAKAVIERRLDAKNVLDRVVTVDSQKKRITVQIPLAKGATIENPGNTIKDLGEMAKLTFRAVDETKKDPDTGAYLPVGEIIVSGDDVASAEAERDPQTSGAVVALKFNSKATKAFAEATKKYLNKPIAIYMDDKQIVARLLRRLLQTEKL
jgi:preprotein translocase subunit SecD